MTTLLKNASTSQSMTSSWKQERDQRKITFVKGVRHVFLYGVHVLAVLLMRESNSIPVLSGSSSIRP